MGYVSELVIDVLHVVRFQLWHTFEREEGTESYKRVRSVHHEVPQTLIQHACLLVRIMMELVLRVVLKRWTAG